MPPPHPPPFSTTTTMTTPWTKFNMTGNWLDNCRNRPLNNNSERTPNWRLNGNTARGTLPLHLQDHHLTPQPRGGKRTPFEEIENNRILDGIIRSITHNGISMDTGNTKSIRLRIPEGMTRQELHVGDTITGMRVISIEGEHIIAE
eukprot:15053606-Heterocapsa_arctica.AAC.1